MAQPARPFIFLCFQKLGLTDVGSVQTCFTFFKMNFIFCTHTVAKPCRSRSKLNAQESNSSRLCSLVQHELPCLLSNHQGAMILSFRSGAATGPSLLAHHGQSSAFIHRGLAEGHQFLCSVAVPVPSGASNVDPLQPGSCWNTVYLSSHGFPQRWNIWTDPCDHHSQIGQREVLQRGVSIVAIKRIIKTRL